jgi:hypothetical protein
MTRKIILLILLSFTLYSSLHSSLRQLSIQIKPYTFCFIENANYKSEFLYASPHKKGDDDWIPFSKSKGNKTVQFKHTSKNVFTNELKLKYMTGIDQVEWLIRPVNWFNETFYISSVKYANYYLCSTHKFSDLFNLRRKVQLIKLNKESVTSNFKCMWRVTEMESLGLNPNFDQGYVLWNEYYEEPLYASSYLFKKSDNRRAVYTWHGLPNSKQFLWRISCY